MGLFAGLPAAIGRAIEAREQLTRSEGLWRSKVSRTPDCEYIRDEGPTLDIEGKLVCTCESCVAYRLWWSDRRAPLFAELDPRDAEDKS